MSMLELFDKKFFKTVIGFGVILTVAVITLGVAGYYLKTGQAGIPAAVSQSVETK